MHPDDKLPDQLSDAQVPFEKTEDITNTLLSEWDPAVSVTRDICK